jgi:hypothetical protein
MREVRGSLLARLPAAGVVCDIFSDISFSAFNEMAWSRLE